MPKAQSIRNAPVRFLPNKTSALLAFALAVLSACTQTVVPAASADPTSAIVASGDGRLQALPGDPIAPLRAPFPMRDLQRPSFPNRRLHVQAFGAVADGKTKNTEAFARAIAELARAGGGSLIVSSGRWLTGPIHLKSNIHLHLEQGAELLFSQDFKDYLPPVFTRWEGMELYNYSPLIYARDCENVAITGEGKLNGQGEAWWPWKKTQKPVAAKLYDMASSGVPVEERVFGVENGLRPSFIQTVGCKNVLIEGVTIVNGPMWTIHPVYSENVIVRKVKVLTNGPNNDGCNPDSSRNVLIEDSFFSTGDDCVVIKSGLNEDGWRVGRPTENVVVRGLTGERGHGGVVIGSEMSGGVRNVYAHDSEFRGTDRGLRIKSMRGRGGAIENIYYEKIRHLGIRLMVVEMTTFYGSSTLEPRSQTPPLIRGVHVRDIYARGAKQAIDVIGLPELPIQDVTFEKIDIVGEQGVRCVDCSGVRFSDAKIVASVTPVFQMENAQNVSVERSCSANTSSCVSVTGARTRGVTLDGAPQQPPP